MAKCHMVMWAGLCLLVKYVSVSCGGDIELCGVDTVLSGAVSGNLCDFDSVSRDYIVMRIDDMSLSRGGDRCSRVGC